MTEEISFNVTPRDEVDAQIFGSILAMRGLLAQIIARMPDASDIIAKTITVGDGLESGSHSTIDTVRVMGRTARETVEDIAKMATAIAARRSGA